MPQELSARKGETVTRILAAAKEVFTEVGFAGARVDEIARRADVNKASLYYHIGDKKALYAEFLHDVIGRAAQKLISEIGRAQTPEEKIRTYIRTLADSIDRHPPMPRIMMREIASGGQNLPELFFQDLLFILSTLTEIIEEGTRDGVFIETMPVLIHLMTLGTIIIYKTSVPIILQQCALPNTLMNLNRDVVGEHCRRGGEAHSEGIKMSII
jgi:AcrR family transcriptional regulator